MYVLIPNNMNGGRQVLAYDLDPAVRPNIKSSLKMENRDGWVGIQRERGRLIFAKVAFKAPPCASLFRQKRARRQKGSHNGVTGEQAADAGGG